MKKVLLITYYWPPAGGPASIRALNFALNLTKLGLEVIILTVDPDLGTYPYFDETLNESVNKNIKVYSTPTREPFALYKKLLPSKKQSFKAFINEGNASFSQKLSRFIRGNVFIPDARRGWNSFAYKKACEIIRGHAIDVVMTSSPPHSTQLIGLELKKKFNLPWIVDLRDPWTQIYFYNSFSHLPFSKWLDKSYERKVINSADRIVTVSEELKQQFLSAYPHIVPEKIQIIINGYNESDFNAIKIDPSAPTEFSISHVGSLSAIHSINIFLRCFKKLTLIHKDSRIKLNLYGEVGTQVLDNINELDLEDHVNLKGIVSHKDAINAMTNSSVLLFAVINTPNNKLISSGKLLEYVASRTPVLCLAPKDGAAAKIVIETKSGKVFDYNDEEQIDIYLNELYLKSLHNALTKNTDETYFKYSRHHNALDLLKIIQSLGSE